MYVPLSPPSISSRSERIRIALARPEVKAKMVENGRRRAADPNDPFGKPHNRIDRPVKNPVLQEAARKRAQNRMRAKCCHCGVITMAQFLAPMEGRDDDACECLNVKACESRIKRSWAQAQA